MAPTDNYNNQTGGRKSTTCKHELKIMVLEEELERAKAQLQATRAAGDHKPCEYDLQIKDLEKKLECAKARLQAQRAAKAAKSSARVALDQIEHVVANVAVPQLPVADGNNRMAQPSAKTKQGPVVAARPAGPSSVTSPMANVSSF